MFHFKSLLPLPVFLCLFLPAAAQDARRDSTSDARELKRSAHRMHIGVEQLKNARQTLREATDLALRVEPTADYTLSTIANVWVELDRPQAAYKLDSLFNLLRSRAQASTTLAEYQHLTQSSLSLLSAIARLDSDKALRLAREWPEPPKRPNESAQGSGESLLSQFLKNNIHQIVYRDPEKALSLLSQQNASGEFSYGTRAQLANQLAGNGRKDEALKFIDRAISDFRQKPASGTPQDYANFLMQIASLDPDRFKNGFTDLVQHAFQPGPKGSTLMQIRIGSEFVQATTEEAATLDAFRGLQSRPEMLLKLLDTVPELKAKIDEFGGIDSFFNPDWNAVGNARQVHIGMMPYGVVVERAGMVSSDGSRSAEAKESPLQLMNELRGKTLKDRSIVRKRLTEAAGTPDRIDVLFSVAQMANHEDPDLSSVALEIASGLVGRIEPLQQRSTMLQTLVRTYRQVEAEVDPSLIKQGFLLADQIREEEEVKAQPGSAQRSGTGLTQADQLEIMLLGEYVRDNFDSAIRYVRSLPDNPFKLAALTQMAQSICQPY